MILAGPLSTYLKHERFRLENKATYSLKKGYGFILERSAEATSSNTLCEILSLFFNIKLLDVILHTELNGGLNPVNLG